MSEPPEGLLFARGYLVTDADLSGSDTPAADFVAQHWRRCEVATYVVHTDPRLEVHAHESHGVHLLVLGLLLDPFSGRADPEEIVGGLHERYRESEAALFETLDALTGRFVLLLVSRERRFVLQDAAGTRSLFYCTAPGPLLHSSHAQLIAELRGTRISNEGREFLESASYRDADDKYFPGVLTPYPDVLALTPNTYLDLDRRRVERFFPRAPLRRRRVTAPLVGELARRFAQQIDALLARKRPLAVSITGGIDSRLTLASTREHRDRIFYYTIVTEGALRQQADAEAAGQLCDHLGIEHHRICAARERASPADAHFLEVFHRSTAWMRTEKQGLRARALLESYPADRLHLKSSFAEVARAFYRKRQRRTRDPATLSRNVSPAVLARLYGIAGGSAFCVSAFRDSMERTCFRSAVGLGYDPYDLFYWEHRMGCWQVLQLLDFDMAQETLVLYNNRRILQAMLSVGRRDRLEGRLHYELIRRLWPETLEVPLNPRWPGWPRVERAPDSPARRPPGV